MTQPRFTPIIEALPEKLDRLSHVADFIETVRDEKVFMPLCEKRGRQITKALVLFPIASSIIGALVGYIFAKAF